MAIATFDDLIAQIGAGVVRRQPVYTNIPSALNTSAFGTQRSTGTMARGGRTRAMPGSLPSGVSGFFPVAAILNSSLACSHILGSFVNLGSFDISGSGTFTDGSAMPTETYLGTSRARISPIFVEVTTPLSFSSTANITVSYTDQDGNASATAAISITNGLLAGQMGFLTLASGDVGCTDIINVTRGGSPGTPSGVIQFWGLVPYGIIPQPTATYPAGESFIGAGSFAARKMGVNEELGIIRYGTQSAGAVMGSIVLVGDD